MLTLLTKQLAPKAINMLALNAHTSSSAVARKALPAAQSPLSLPSRLGVRTYATVGEHSQAAGGGGASSVGPGSTSMSERNKLSPEMKQQIHGEDQNKMTTQSEQGGTMQRRVPDVMGMPAPFRRMSDYMADMQQEMEQVMSAFGMPTDPFEMFDRMERQMAPMLPALTVPQTGMLRNLTMDVEETKDAYMVHAEVPGFNKDEIKVVVSPEGVLTVQGEKKQEEQQLAASGKEGETSGSTAPARYSRRYSAFKRSVLLPGDVKEEAINATVKNGVLTITVPKVPMPEATKPREIPVHMA